MRTVLRCIALLLAIGIGTLDALGEDPPSKGQEQKDTAADADTPPNQEDSPPEEEEKKEGSRYIWEYHWDWEKGFLYQYKRVIALPFGFSMPHDYEDIRFHGKIGMNLMLDGAVYRETKDMPLIDNGVELRRALVKTTGNFQWGTPVDYRVEFQYVNDSGFSFKKLNLRFRELPVVGSIWFGQFNMPQGLGMMTRSKDITFMEAAAPLEAMAPGTKFGVQVGDPILDGRGTLNAGIFTDSNNFEIGDSTEALARLGGRATFLPHISGEDEELDLLHLGLSTSIVYSPDAQVRYRSRPESHLAPELVDTGKIDAEFSWVTGLEGAAVWGPFHVQSEFMHSLVYVQDGSPLSFWGAYAHVGWFPTGEVRPYKKDLGYFGHLKPNLPIQFPGGPSQGAGALELAARLSFIDLNDEFIEGGRMGILMTGATWFLSNNVRLILNIGAANVDHPDHDSGLYIIQTRFQWTY